MKVFTIQAMTSLKVVSLSAKTDQHKLYYHKLGTEQAHDKLVFGGTDAEKHRYVSGEVTKDGKYLLVSAAVSTSGTKLFIKDLPSRLSIGDCC